MVTFNLVKQNVVNFCYLVKHKKVGLVKLNPVEVTIMSLY